MARVVRLLTVAELDEGGTGDLSVSARLDAVLDDGRRVVLLDDRGWTQTMLVAAPPGVRPDPPALSEADIAQTARQVVGPDEAYGRYTQAEMDDGHWRTLAGTLAEQGIEADPDELRRLPHDVELGEALRARLGYRA